MKKDMSDKKTNSTITNKNPGKTKAKIEIEINGSKYSAFPVRLSLRWPARTIYLSLLSAMIQDSGPRELADFAL